MPTLLLGIRRLNLYNLRFFDFVFFKLLVLQDIAMLVISKSKMWRAVSKREFFLSFKIQKFFYESGIVFHFPVDGSGRRFAGWNERRLQLVG